MRGGGQRPFGIFPKIHPFFLWQPVPYKLNTHTVIVFTTNFCMEIQHISQIQCLHKIITGFVYASVLRNLIFRFKFPLVGLWKGTMAH